MKLLLFCLCSLILFSPEKEGKTVCCNGWATHIVLNIINGLGTENVFIFKFLIVEINTFYTSVIYEPKHIRKALLRCMENVIPMNESYI